MDNLATAVKRPRPRLAVEQMAPYTPPTSSRRGKLRLDFNENTVGCSPRVLRWLKKHVDRETLAVYPEYGDARARMAVFLGLKPEQVLFTNGTDEAIHSLLNTYVDAGDEVVIPWPTYAMFRFYSELAAATPRAVPYRAPDLSFPLEELCEAVTPRTRAVLIANPNNPTGTAIGLAEIEKVLTHCQNAAVLIDEAYFDFHGVTAAPLLGEYPNLFISRTFSKVYGLAGMRVGCLLSQAENIESIHKGQSPYSVNSLGIKCSLEAVEDQEYIRSYVKEVLEARDILCRGLKRLRIPYYPSGANFILAHLGDQSREICSRLRERGILIRDRGSDIPGTARITAGKKAQIRRLLRELKEVLQLCGS